MKQLFAFLFACNCLNAKPVITEKFLDSVGMIESNFNPKAVGDKGRALGIYQLHQGAWTDSCIWLENNDDGKAEYEYSLAIKSINGDWKKLAKDPDISRVVAKGYFDLLLFRFNRQGINPTQLQLYMAYNMGFTGAKKFDFNPANPRLDSSRFSILKRASIILSQ